MDCTTTIPELEEIASRIEAVEKIFTAAITLPTKTKIEFNSLRIMWKMRSVLKLTNVICYKIGEQKCVDCAIHLENRLRSLLELFKEVVEMLGEARYLPITSWVLYSTVANLEDRLDTLRFITDDELHTGMDNLISELQEHPPASNWRDTIEAF